MLNLCSAIPCNVIIACLNFVVFVAISNAVEIQATNSKKSNNLV